MTVVIWSTISSAGRPNMRSALAFQLVRRRSSEALVIASLEDLDDRGEAGAGLLGQLALGDVDEEPLDPEGCPALVPHEDRLVQHPDDPTVGCDVAILGAEGLPVSRRRSASARTPSRTSGCTASFREGRPLDPLVGRVAEQGLDLRADVDVPHGLVCRADVGHQRKVLDQRAVAELRLAQGGLRAPALLQLLLRRAVQTRALERERGEVCESGEQRDLRSAEGLARVVVREPEHPLTTSVRGSQRHADHAMKPVRFEARQAAVPGRVVDRERL